MIEPVPKGRWSTPVDLGLVTLALVHGYVAAFSISPLTVPLTVAGAFAIFLRHRSPAATFVISLPGFILADGIVAPLVGLFSLAESGLDRRYLYPLTVFVAIGFTAFWRGFFSLEWAITLSTYSIAGAVGATATGMLVRTRRRLSASIEELRLAEEAAIERVARDVRGTERARLAREMHDVVSHQVSLIAVQAGALQVTSKEPGAVEAGKTIRSLAVRTIDELRSMVTILRASDDDSRELAPQFTIADINSLIQRSEADIDAKIEVPDGLPSSVQRAVYRTVQEGLVNAERYAPGAPVKVRCSASDRTLLLTVRNSASLGRSGEVISTGHGLIGLVERAELLGGTLEAGPVPEGGFVIRLQVPLIEAG